MGTLAIGFFIFFVAVTIVLIAFQNQIIELKQQIQIHQDKVPVCDFEYGYWGFKVICSDDFFGWGNMNKVIDQHFHESLESCEESLKFYISYENCEVRE